MRIDKALMHQSIKSLFKIIFLLCALLFADTLAAQQITDSSKTFAKPAAYDVTDLLKTYSRKKNLKKQIAVR